MMSIVGRTVRGWGCRRVINWKRKCWNADDFCLLFWVPITQVCSFCDNPLSCILIICASFFCILCYTSAKITPLSPQMEKLRTLPVIHLLYYQEILRHNGENLWMLWILILLKLTFASVMSTKINTSILKTFAKETNVFDEKTKKTIFPLASICWIGGSKHKTSKLLLNLLTRSVYSRFRIFVELYFFKKQNKTIGIKIIVTEIKKTEFLNCCPGYVLTMHRCVKPGIW